MTEEQALELARKLNALYQEAGLDGSEINTIEFLALNLRTLRTTVSEPASEEFREST
jgi:hypothetical protein